MNSLFKKFRGTKKKENAPELDLETLRSIQIAQRQMDILEQQFKQKQAFQGGANDKREFQVPKL